MHRFNQYFFKLSEVNPAMKKLSVIMPVYNEKKTINEILTRIRKVSLNAAKEIIIVDDASDDGTKEILDDIKNN